MERSKPNSRAAPAGTISNSADKKSSSSKPYCSFKTCNTYACTPSLSSPLTGRLPIRRSNCSPSTTLAAFFSICSCPKCGNKSVTQNTGSVGLSPMANSTTEPSRFTTTPWIAKGIVTHWYFLIPP